MNAADGEEREEEKDADDELSRREEREESPFQVGHGVSYDDEQE